MIINISSLPHPCTHTNTLLLSLSPVAMEIHTTINTDRVAVRATVTLSASSLLFWDQFRETLRRSPGSAISRTTDSWMDIKQCWWQRQQQHKLMTLLLVAMLFYAAVNVVNLVTGLLLCYCKFLVVLLLLQLISLILMLLLLLLPLLLILLWLLSQLLICYPWSISTNIYIYIYIYIVSSVRAIVHGQNPLYY